VRASLIVDRLRELGLELTVDMVMKEAGDASVGRPHIARALIRAGSVRDFREAFDRYLGSGRPGFVAKERLEVKDAIAMTHEAGGLAIWAHPWKRRAPRASRAARRSGIGRRRSATPQSPHGGRETAWSVGGFLWTCSQRRL
jgi:predicted metal-dependent phosphoesterase TrpH